MSWGNGAGLDHREPHHKQASHGVIEEEDAHFEKVIFHISFQATTHHCLQSPLSRVVSLKRKGREGREEEVFQGPHNTGTVLTIAASLRCSSSFTISSKRFRSSGETNFSTVTSLSWEEMEADRGLENGHTGRKREKGIVVT